MVVHKTIEMMDKFCVHGYEKTTLALENLGQIKSDAQVYNFSVMSTFWGIVELIFTIFENSNTASAKLFDCSTKPEARENFE